MPIKTLLVDDDSSLLEQAKIFLEKIDEDLEVSTVSSAKKALELLDEEKYDVIVSDYQMPDMDGLEFLEELRNEINCDLPFIMFTGKGREEVAMEALNLGADRYLQKGGDPKAQFGVLADAIMQEYGYFEKNRALERSEREKSKILDSTAELIAYQNEKHEVLWANQAAGDSVDEESEDLEGRKCYEIWHGREEPCEGCPVQRALDSKEIERGEVRSIDGRYWFITGNPIIDENGDIEGVVEAGLDITERKETEEELQEREKRYRELFNQSPVGVWEEDFSQVKHKIDDISEEGVEDIGRYLDDHPEFVEELVKCVEIISVNESVLDMYKADSIEEFKQGLSKIFGKRSIPAFKELVKKIAQGEIEYTTEKVDQSLEGEDIHILLKWSVVSGHEEDYSRVIVSTVDITEHKKSEKEKEKHLHELDERLKELSCLYSLERIIKNNDRIEDVFSQTVKLIASSWQYPDVTEARITYEDRVFKTEDFKETEWMQRSEIVVKGKEVGKVEVSYLERRPEEDEGPFLKEEIDLINSIASRLGSFIERKRTEKRFKKIFENLGDAVIIKALGGKNDGRILEANQAMCELFGYSREELEGMNVYDEIVCDEPEETTWKEIKEGLKEGRRTQFSVKKKKKDGSEVWVEVVAIPLRHQGEDAVLAVNRDITESKEKDQVLKRERKKFEEMFNNANDAMYLHELTEEDMPGKFIEVNETAAEMLGYSREEFLEMSPADIDAEEMVEGLPKVMNELVDEGEIKFKGIHQTKDGKKIPVEIHSHLFELEGEKRVLSIARDISERKESEKKLKSSERKFRRIFEASPDPTFLLDKDGVFTDVNEVALKKLGYDKEEIVGKELDEMPFLEEKAVEKTVENFLKRKEGKEVPPYEIEMISKDGEVHHAEINAKIFMEEEFEGEVVIARDITERKKAEKKLRESERRYDLALRGAELGVWDWNVKTDEVKYSDQWAEMLGYSPDEIEQDLGSWEKRVHPDERSWVKEELQKHLDGEKDIFKTEHRMETKSGDWIWVKNVGKVFERDENGEPVRATGILEDITYRKEVEEELRRKEVYLEHIPEFVVVLDEEGEIRYWNPSSSKLNFELLEADEIVDNSVFEFVHLEDREKTVEMFTKAVENPGEEFSTEVRGKSSDGWVWFEARAVNYLEDPEIKGIVVTGREIEKRKEKEKELKRSKERYQSLIENSIVGVSISDFEDNILFVNRHFASMLGYPEEELVGKNIAELTTEEEYQRLSEKTDERKEGESEVYETKLMRKNGTLIDVILGAAPYFDAEGKMNGTVAFIQDISERKEAEEREQFLHSLLRHDIRNKIQTIDGYHELMKMDSELSDKAEEYLDKAKKGVKNSIELIEKIRTLREAQDEELQEIELESMIDNLVREKESQIGDIELEMNIRCIGDCSVTAGPLLKEVFSNIIENSVKYAEGTKIRISAEKSEDEIICAIEDDGKGIPEDKRGTIFQKGYTTDEERGTGLGLFLVKTLMEIYGGNIKVKDSELGGARFDVHLKKA